ncbi:GntP family permease [Alkalicoccus saliphilus]|uniref:Gluconate:proton symporter n=1 Tax=Alkalicoccus saliphilus TaxID=200989 RepID=A0A2T4U7A2_9BACI|nr:GntP family permease [Alkalicoccus saliphilus]PTL39287.1 gluconate:proton symporter [Alkalicoccus saliphilus]
MTITAFGAVAGLLSAIVLILIKLPPVYALLLGAVLGGIIGGADLPMTISFMMEGAEGMIPAVLRVLAAGVLAGVMIESGAASSIASAVVKALGEKRALLALVLATMILTAVGVFIVVAVMTVASIALAIAYKAHLSKAAVLLAMVGGGKAGNLISPNPNTIALADAFDLPLTTVMAAGLPSASAGVVTTYLIAKKLGDRGAFVDNKETPAESVQLPHIGTSVIAPALAIFLLLLNPAAGIDIDPLIALPTGAVAGALAMRKASHLNEYVTLGLGKVSAVAVLLLGTGTIAGIISNSALPALVTGGVDTAGMPAFLIAPLSGILMGGATASTTAGSVVAGEVFSGMLLELGVSALAGAAMIHAGATMIDHLPHGSFFHASAASVGMAIKERLKLFPYETAIGTVLTLTAVLLYGVLDLF